jgi:hypothetical protein
MVAVLHRWMVEHSASLMADMMTQHLERMTELPLGTPFLEKMECLLVMMTVDHWGLHSRPTKAIL